MMGTLTGQNWSWSWFAGGLSVAFFLLYIFEIVRTHGYSKKEKLLYSCVIFLTIAIIMMFGVWKLRTNYVTATPRLVGRVDSTHSNASYLDIQDSTKPSKSLDKLQQRRIQKRSELPTRKATQDSVKSPPINIGPNSNVSIGQQGGITGDVNINVDPNGAFPDSNAIIQNHRVVAHAPEPGFNPKDTTLIFSEIDHTGAFDKEADFGYRNMRFHILKVGGWSEIRMSFQKTIRVFGVVCSYDGKVNGIRHTIK